MIKLNHNIFDRLEGENMDFTNLNPFIRSGAKITKLGASEECIAYDCRVIYVFSGDVTASVNGEKAVHLGAGNLLYIPAGVKYRLKGKFLEAALVTFDTTPDYCMKKDKIPPVAVEDFDKAQCHEPLIHPFDRPILLSEMESESDAFHKICNLFISREGAYRSRASAIFKLILLKIAETADDSALPSRMVEELDRYIRENYTDDISNTEIGAIFGYHPFYVSKVLKDKKGITLKQYVIRYKLKAAAALLENSAKTINEIAEETGFTDASYFTKSFKSVFGETPKEYRSRFKDGFV